MRGRQVLRSVLAGIVIFSLGVAAARLLGATSSSPGSSTSLAEGGRVDAGSADGASARAEPKIVFDPSSINLLPDASLRLDLEVQKLEKP